MTDDVARRRPLAIGIPQAGDRVGELLSPLSEKEALEELHREGLEIQARSHWDLFKRKFLRHKLAVGSLVLLFLIIVSAVFADLIAPYEFDQIDLANRSLGPTLEGFHLFGTDKIGRDYFTRVLFGIRTSLQVAFVVGLVSTILGAVVGAIAGYFGRWVDNLLMRFTDLFLTLPFFAVLLIAAAFLGRGSPIRVSFIVALLLWPTLARVVRGSFLSLREKEFVEAARASGASDWRIIFRHMLPNALSPIIVNLTLTIATAILLEASLSFLGFGIQPPTPALGKLIADGKDALVTQWWLVTFPGAMIVVISLCINFLGDGLRDALDPFQRAK
ncbi:MAG: ABC transporter permease [Actinomycetota bacterium]